MRIVLMGTPDFAVPTLDALIDSKHEVVGVVTTPDRPAGRGRKLRPSPVKQKALEKELPIAQPEELEDPAFIRTLEEWAPELQVVVAFRLLPKVIWDLPPIGTINLHASLLPYYRGAAPIQRALMNGEKRTGVTTFFIDEGMDRGKLLLQEEIGVDEDTTAGELHDQLMDMGSRLVVRTVDGLEQGDLEGREQKKLAPSERDRAKAPKIEKEDRPVRWEESAGDLHNRIRALSPYPGALTRLSMASGEPLSMKLLRSHLPEETVADEAKMKGAAGEVLKAEGSEIRVKCGNGTLSIRELQASGKRAMTAEAFLRGYSLKKGDRFLSPDEGG